MGLMPVEADGGHRTQIETVDVAGVHQGPPKGLVPGDPGGHQRGTDGVDHLDLRAAHHRYEGVHVLLARQAGFGRLAVHHRGPQVIAALHANQSVALPEPAGHFLDALLLQPDINVL